MGIDGVGATEAIAARNPDDDMRMFKLDATQGEIFIYGKDGKIMGDGVTVALLIPTVRQSEGELLDIACSLMGYSHEYHIKNKCIYFFSFLYSLALFQCTFFE